MTEISTGHQLGSRLYLILPSKDGPSALGFCKFGFSGNTVSSVYRRNFPVSGLTYKSVIQFYCNEGNTLAIEAIM